MSYIDKHGVEWPDGFTPESMNEITRFANNQFVADQVRVFGEFRGPEISRDMARCVLLVAETFNNMTDEKARGLLSILSMVQELTSQINEE